MSSFAERLFDKESKCLIIAELSANHGGSLETAINTIRAAAISGADGIKLQTYTPDTITIDCDNDYFKIKEGSTWGGKSLYQLYQEAYTPWEWHKEMFRVAQEEGLICFSSPFDNTAIDFLETLESVAYKIASFEIQDVSLIAYAASKGKPMILSTGIASREDIALAVETCRKEGNNQIVLLKCTSSYPAPVELANLKTMTDMQTLFNVSIGLSDHTLSPAVPVAAVTLGARLIEKHFILDRSIGGPDASFSLDPDAFANMVSLVREAELALGEVTYELPDKVLENRNFSRSLFVVKDIAKWEAFTGENIRSIRPGYGLHPKFLKDTLGRKANKDLKYGTPLKQGDIS